MKLFIQNKNSVSNISIFILCLLILYAMEPWPLWYYRGVWFILLCMSFLFFRSFQSKIKVSSSILICIFWGIAFLVWMYARKIDGIESFIRFIFQAIVLIFVLLMADTEKKKIITMFTKLFAWIVGISIIFYILVVFCGINLPYKIIKNSTEWYPPFRNYLFFIVTDENIVLFHRFRSIFTEPGHLGTYSAIILYINKYELKRKAILIIFIGILLSLSLGAYVLTILGYFFYRLAQSKRMYKNLSITVFCGLLLVISGGYMYNHYPDSIFSQLIIARLQYDEDKGFSGNNRINANFDTYYENKFKTSTSLLLYGLGDEHANELAKQQDWIFSGYKGFWVRHGIVGIFLIMLFYRSIVIYRKSPLMWGLFVLYCASFLQRAMFSMREAEMFLFIGATEMFQLQIKSLSNKKC